MSKTLAGAVLGALTACFANAATYTWIGRDGSLSGNWSDTRCWQGGAKPDVNAEDSVISGNRYSAIYLPLSKNDYTITLDEDVFVTNCLLQVMTGSGTGGTITITGSGKKLTTRKANGPGVNNNCANGMKLRFVDVDVELRGCNPLGGEIVVGDGADFTTGGFSLYCNTDKSRFTVEEGGKATVAAVDNRGNSLIVTVKGGELDMKSGSCSLCKDSQLVVNGGTFAAKTVSFAAYSGTTGLSNGAKFEVNGGVATVGTFSFAANSSNSAIRLTGGTLYSDKPAIPATAAVDFTGGTWTLNKMTPPLLTYEDHALLPQGDGVLDLQTDSTTFELGHGICLLASERGNENNPGVFMTNALFSGTIQLTNLNSRADIYTRGGDAVTTVGRRGKLIVPSWTGREKGLTADSKSIHQFDLDLFVVAHGCHSASTAIVNDFLNGVTIGANGDWNTKNIVKVDGSLSGGNISRFRFNDYVTFDTLDYLNKTGTHKIEIYKTLFNGVTNLTVRGGGEVTLWTVANYENVVGEICVEEGTTLNLPGAMAASNTDPTVLPSANLVTADRVTLGPRAKLTLNATISTLYADGFTADETSEVVINCPVEMAAGGIKTRIKSKTLGQCPKVTVAGPYAGGWTAKNVAGVIYLADGTTPELPAGSKPYTWSGAVDGKFSEPGNWFGGAAPSTTAASGNELVFAGIRNTVITNDMTSGSADSLSVYNLQFANGCGPVELHGNPLLFSPGGYGGVTSAVYDDSDFPVAIFCDLKRPNGKFGLHNVGNSALHVMGDLDAGTGSSANIYTRGDVRLGGTVTAGSVIYFPKGRSDNNLRILSDASLTLSRPDVVKQINQDESIGVATLTVEEGGSFTTEGDAYDPGRAQLAHVVNGTATLTGGLSPTSRDQVFTGTGTLVCGASCPTTNAVARTVTLGGGLTFVPTGDWRTLTASNADRPLTIRVEGDVTVAAGADWTYGAPGVATATAAEDRALVAAAGSTLTFAATDYVTKLADPVVSAGAVVFEEGAKVEPAGDLLDASWTTFMQAEDFVGLPTSVVEGKFRIVESDGCRLLQFKARSGFTVLIK